MKSTRIPVPIGQTVDLMVKDIGSWGSTVLLYNSGTVALTLGGEDLAANNGWRGFVVGSVVSADLANDEKVYVHNPSATVVGEVDMLVIK